MIFGLVCWGESIEKQDRNKLNKNKKKKTRKGDWERRGLVFYAEPAAKALSL